MSNLHVFDIMFIAIYLHHPVRHRVVGGLREKNVSSNYFSRAGTSPGSRSARPVCLEHRQRAAGRLAGPGAGSVSRSATSSGRLLDPAAVGGCIVPYYLKARYTMPSS